MIGVLFIIARHSAKFACFWIIAFVDLFIKTVIPAKWNQESIHQQIEVIRVPVGYLEKRGGRNVSQN